MGSTRFMSLGHASKLTEQDVANIKRMLREGWSGVEIAAQFGISKSLVSKIHTGKRWSWVSADHVIDPGAPRPRPGWTL